MSEKQHKASATRLRRAREKGDIASSQEVPRATGFIGAVLAMVSVAPALVDHIGELLKETLREPLRDDVDVYGQALSRFMDLGLWGLILAIPLAYALAAAAGTFLQTRGLITFAKLEPDINRINPAEGLKKIFSIRGLVDFVRVIVKSLLCGGALVGVLWALAEPISKLPFTDISVIVPLAWKAVLRLFSVAAIVYVLSALFDIWFENFEYQRRHRMTHEEVRQENKDQFGDPHVRGERKSLQREGARSGGLKEVVQFAALAIAGPGPILLLIGFGKTPKGPALMLLKKTRGPGADALRNEVVRQGKSIVSEARLAGAINDRVAEKALLPEPLSGEIFAILATMPRA
jgi:type III secretion protein U